MQRQDCKRYTLETEIKILGEGKTGREVHSGRETGKYRHEKGETGFTRRDGINRGRSCNEE
jgi:hypothetical protein